MHMHHMTARHRADRTGSGKSTVGVLRTAAIAVLALMIALFAGTIAATASGAAPAVGSCTPSPVTDPMAITLSKSSGLIAWETVRASFTGSISNGHCAGDQFTITVPPELQAQDGAKYDLKSPDGQVVAVMTVVGSKLVVTLTDYVQTHQDVTLNGWVDVELTDVVAPGTTTSLKWDVSGKAVTTPITTAPCPNCTVMPTTAQKWGVATGPGELKITIATPTAVVDDQAFSFTDTLTSPGQAFTCPVTATTQQFTARDQWGIPINPVAGPAVTITSCSATEAKGTFTIAKSGQAVRLYLPVTVTDSTATSWTDSATVVSKYSTDSVTTRVVSYGGGGSGDGTTPTQSPTSTTTAPTTTSTSRTSGVLPTATTSTLPTSSPSTTSGVLPTSTTSTTSPSAQVLTPTPALAFTGSSTAAIVAVGSGLLALGCVLLLVTGRRRSVPD